MVKAVQNKFIFLTALIVIIGFLFYATAGFFLQDRLITAKVVSVLQKSIQKTGLQVSVGRVHWAGFNRIQATRIVCRDTRDNSIPFQTEKLNLNLDLFTFISNRLHPESSLREIELLNPRFELRRFSDGTWNFNNYLLPQKKQIQMQMSLRIRNGVVELQDYQYGRHMFQKIDGKVNLNKYSLLTWAVNGVADFNKRMQWSSLGKCRIDQLTGIGELTANHVSIDNLVSFVPDDAKYQIRSGFSDVRLQFAWNKEGIWLENGAASLYNVSFVLPWVQDPFVIKQLEVEFSPIQCKVKKAYLVHNRTVIKASGLVNNKTNSIKAELSAEQVSLADLDRLFPIVTRTALQGEADLRLAVVGSLDNPILSGELFINNGQLVLAGQKTVTQISGRMTIRENNLKIQRLEGTWNKSLLGIRGSIDNLFNPRLDLHVYGSGLTFQPDELTLLNEQGFKTGGPIDFIGAITGKPNSPKILGEISVEKLFYQGAPFENLKFKLEWDGNADSLRVLEAQGDLWDGHLTAKGEVRVNPKGVKWQISGQVVDLNVSKITSSTDWEVKGRVSSDLIFKGNWHKGTPFQSGSVLGIFKGENLAYQDASVEEANGVFSWINGNLNIDSIQAKIGQGMIYGHLSWNSTKLAASVSAENIRIHKLLPDKRAYPLDGIFNGNFSFVGPPQELTGKINGIFSEVTWSGRQVGTISGVLDYNTQELNITEALVATDMGDYHVTGRIDFMGGPWLSLQIMSDNAQLNGLPKWFPAISALKPNGNATINCTINGQFDNPDIQGEASLITPVFGPLQMEQAFLKVTGNLKKLSINEFKLTKQDSYITLTGEFSPNQLDLYIKGSALQLGTMQLVYGGKAIQGTIDFQGRITGDPLSPVLSGQIAGGELSFGTFNFQQLAARIIWKSQIIEVESARLSQDQTVVSLNGKISLAKAWPFDLNVEVSDLNLENILNNIPKLPPGFEATGKLSGLVKLTGDFNNPQIQINGGLSQGILNTLPVNGEFNLSYNNHRVYIKKFLLNQGTGILLANGAWEAGQLARVSLGLQNFPCQVINPFIKPAYKLTGVANAFALLEWSNLGVSGEYSLVVNDLSFNEYLLGDLNVNGDLYDQGISIGEGTLIRKGSFITANGYIPWPTVLLEGLKLPIAKDHTSRNLNINVNLKNIPADFANQFTSRFTVSNGSLDGELRLGGSLTELQTVGTIDLNDLTLSIVGLPCSIEDFQASVSFDGAKATIKKARGNYGQGKFNINGSAEYTGLKIESFNLGFTGSDIYYTNPYFNGYGNLNLKLDGPLAESIISGDIVLFNSRFSLISYGATKGSPSIWNPTLRIGIRTRENVRYRQVGLADVTINGKVQVQGKFTDPKLEGEVVTRQGLVTLYSRTFKVKHGIAVFKYAEGFLPYIDVNSSSRSSKVEVFLTAKGQIGKNITINLTSEPYMSRSELFTMLNWPELNDQQDPTTVNDIVTGNISLVTDTIFGDFLFQIRNALALDYLYLEPNYQQNDLRLHVGSNITEDLFLSYSRSFIYTLKDNWELDYQITPRLSLGVNFSLLDETIWRLIYRFNF